MIRVQFNFCLTSAVSVLIRSKRPADDEIYMLYGLKEENKRNSRQVSEGKRSAVDILNGAEVIRNN